MPVRPNPKQSTNTPDSGHDGLLEAVLSGVSDGVIFVGRDGVIGDLNPAARAIFGYTADEAIGLDISALLPIDVQRWLDSPAQGMKLLERSEFIAGQEINGRHKAGTAVPLLVSLSRPDDADATALVVLVRCLTERREADQKIRELTLTDPLTGLANRNLFHIKLADACNHAERRGRTVALLLLDLDGFKGINDNFGHSVGDALLLEVANRLRDITRKIDTVARLDGDGFAVVVGDLDQPGAVQGLAQRIIDGLSHPIVLNGSLLQTGISIGASFFPGDGTQQDELIRKADLALEDAKRVGQGRFHIFERQTDTKKRNEKALELDLRLALVRGEFLLNFQPMLDITCRDVVAAEALIRWQHPARGMVLPCEFIPVAETSDVMVPLGEWVLRAACAQNKAWQDAGLPPLRVAVNISARQLQHVDFMSMLRNTLRETGLDPKWLELEITEGMMMNDIERVISTFHQINDLGVDLSIDDFGTGYSSLAYLKRFPVQRLKIDQSFVRDLAIDADDAAITEAVITMGHSLKLKIVAEGVEAEHQVDFLRHKGCDELQGFLFSEPLSPEGFAKWYGAWLAAKPRLPGSRLPG